MAYLVRRKPFVSTQNKAARLRFAKLHLKIHKMSGTVSFGQTKLNWEKCTVP